MNFLCILLHSSSKVRILWKARNKNKELIKYYQDKNRKYETFNVFFDLITKMEPALCYAVANAQRTIPNHNTII